MDQSDVHTLERCASGGGVDDWVDFESAFRPSLVAGIARALGLGGARPDRERVSELLQEVYCRLLEADRQVLGRFRGTTSREAHAYLKRIALSVTLDRMRHERAAKRGARLIVTSLAEAVSEAVPATAPTPEQALVWRESWGHLWRDCRGVLRHRYAARDLAILQLALFEGWTSREIAAEMRPRLTVSAVDTILHRVRRRLRARGIELPERGRRGRKGVVSPRPADSGSG